jgi:hypothetical protein
MKANPSKFGDILFSGWIVMLVSSAVILTRTVSNAIAFPILGLMLVWFLLSVLALGHYLYRAWRRTSAVPHKLAYVAWMTIETVFALSAVAGIVWLLVIPSQATKSVSWREIASLTMSALSRA